jgi:glycosyltransferase involved in cell wall biosynthesis
LLPYYKDRLLKYKINDFLKLIIYEYNGEYTKALQLIKKFFNYKNISKNPDILLLYSNIKSSINNSDSKKLLYLNKYLRIHGLTQLCIKDKFSIFNLSSYKLKSYKPFSNEKVSVIMTTYNSEKFLNYSIKSILDQTYQNIELIIVDDNSNDRTLDYLLKIRKIYKNKIKIISLKHNVGTYVAKNIGILHSSGNIITFHDSDDFSHSQKIELQLKSLLRDDKVASISYWIRMDKNGIYKSFKLYPFLRMNLSSLMIKKEIIKKIGYFDSVKTGADNEFYHRIERVYGTEYIAKIKKPLAIGLYRDNSLMTSTDTGLFEKKGLNDRLDYWEAWNYWHKDCFLNNKTPYIAFFSQKRPFKAPESIITNFKSVDELIGGVYENV